MIDFLARLDLGVLHFLNVEMASPVLDQFWLGITQMHKADWFRFIVLPGLLAFLFYIYRGRAFALLIAVGLAVGLADTLAYRGIKSVVTRQRPFQNAELNWVRKVGQAHGPSFPSNHAANVFAAAAVLSWYFPPAAPGFYTLAGLVAISRPALGVHYPSDALAGMILGLFVGFMIRIFLLNRVKWFRRGERVSSADGLNSADRIRSRRSL